MQIKECSWKMPFETHGKIVLTQKSSPSKHKEISIVLFSMTSNEMACSIMVLGFLNKLNNQPKKKKKTREIPNSYEHYKLTLVCKSSCFVFMGRHRFSIGRKMKPLLSNLCMANCLKFEKKKKNFVQKKLRISWKTTEIIINIGKKKLLTS